MTIGKSIYRKEALEKVTGTAKYTDDYTSPSMLHAKLVVSTHAHAIIKAIDTSEALKAPGVRAIVTGQPDFPLTGEEIHDRPPIAYGKVRHHGEAVAIVVADTPHMAKKAAELVKVDYEPLPVVNSPTDAISASAPLVHEQLAKYEKIQHVYPEPNTNIADRVKIRKGHIEQGWQESEVTVEARFSFGPSDHAAMETRCATAEIRPDGHILISSSSQAPYMIKKLMSEYFKLDAGKIIVTTPLVGGGYGGKVPTQLEIIAYLASKAVGGRPVKVFNEREEDMITSPVHIGLEATVKLGCRRDGVLKAAKLVYLFDSGAYSDKGATITRAAAASCTGPYHIDNVWCDSLCVYTNHPYATAYRGFSHSEVLFAFERTMDMLAEKLGMDPLELREKNAILPGHTTPTQADLNASNVGNLPECIRKLKELMKWDEGRRMEVNGRKVIAKGIACIWKTSTIDTKASSGVILMYNPDGSLNLMSGLVEIGTGSKTVLAQILADKMKMDISQIYVRMEVDTQTMPEHWKTVASRGTYMAGRAVLQAADDLIRQLKDIASRILVCSPDELEVGFGKVYVRDDPTIYSKIPDIAYGHKYPNGNAIGGQIMAKGNYMFRHMTHLDRDTGAGKPGPEWTVGAQGIELEFDTRDFTYKLLKAYAVIDIGKVLNYKAALGQVIGAMSMGLGFAGRESFIFDEKGKVLNPQLRTYVTPRYGEHPDYIVEFVETPHIDAPYGARGIGEHGLLGMPAALANALSTAAGLHLNQLPLVPELIWKAKTGGTER
ncbi:xanthine dehydrogenase family protein molybdopterin-binding subunit [Paenibacillus alkaliterrae]|uniref:xanthine dehydrogenase family protein molybdopterin-binding subunit n=1 Tax=Paenibacillus alkaliterrae TaxID=320909 RepID=UPI001F34EF3A|nr:xanthine dehydrogenase family protein molybdopterin-binding subunit [Paenibacillus alkaliterrae]MCF2941668.1 xanthine dehydrogenase family protein molybdopterin-binding subunit [Paenibacillus alkaliterrae]